MGASPGRPVSDRPSVLNLAGEPLDFYGDRQMCLEKALRLQPWQSFRHKIELLPAGNKTRV
jgi:hypothetical protein